MRRPLAAQGGPQVPAESEGILSTSELQGVALTHQRVHPGAPPLRASMAIFLPPASSTPQYSMKPSPPPQERGSLTPLFPRLGVFLSASITPEGRDCVQSTPVSFTAQC